MSNKPAKRHHLIPQFYLDAFSEKGKLQMQELAGKAYLVSKTNAFVVNDFYRKTDDNAENALEFEDHLANVEAIASNALRSLRNNRRIDLEEKSSIAEFLLAQWARGDGFRSASRSFKNLALRDMARNSSEKDVRLFHEISFEGPVEDEEWESIWKRYTCDEGPGFYSTVESSFSQFKQLTKDTKQSILLTRKWVVLDFGRPTLISGDRPVIISDFQRTSNSVLAPGIAVAQQIIFPMSRSLALILERESDETETESLEKRLYSIQWMTGKQELAEEINVLVALNARKKIFGHPSDMNSLRDLSMISRPIENWITASDWGEATRRITELKDLAVESFKDFSREQLDAFFAMQKSQGSNGKGPQLTFGSF
ncbi:DUF4238 domain-containing protein [Corynebacterium glutamicum]|uniref:DUF4238 domain-containing protein n=1 Tax=Corynebacterium glutamicum TaxID=1718 RepID=UPI00094301AB|nr:DUF4238 domain-containing protein [Corynebacterium glutamicum]OKX85368.1 hypothetical protein AUO95_00265 [Corynebacterium glutamicum]